MIFLETTATHGILRSRRMGTINAPWQQVSRAGRERLSLQHFYERMAFRADAISLDDLNHYTASFEAAEAMRAGFELYRAFDRDAEDNRAALKKSGRLTMPVLALGGASSFFVPLAKPMLQEVAKEVTVATIPECGHWVAEENPSAFLNVPDLCRLILRLLFSVFRI